MPDDMSGRSPLRDSNLVIQMLQSVCGAVKALSLYPQESPVLANMIDRARGCIAEFIPRDGYLELSVIEDKLLVNGEILDVALQKHTTVLSFQEMMKSRLLRSITFWDGLSNDETRLLLSLLGQWAPAVAAGQSGEVEGAPARPQAQYMEVGDHIYITFGEPEKKRKISPDTEQREPVTAESPEGEVLSLFLGGEIPLPEAKDLIIEQASRPDEMLGDVREFVSSRGWDNEDEAFGIAERLISVVELAEDTPLESGLLEELGGVATRLKPSQLVGMFMDPRLSPERASRLLGIVLPLLGKDGITSCVGLALSEYKEFALQSEGGGWPTPRMMALCSLIREMAACVEGEISGVVDGLIKDIGVDLSELEGAEAKGTALAKSLLVGADITLCDAACGPTLVEASKYLFAGEQCDLGDIVMDRLSERFMCQEGGSRVTAARQILGLSQALQELGIDVSGYGMFKEAVQAPGGRPSHQTERVGPGEEKEEVTAGSTGLIHDEVESPAIKETSVKDLIEIAAFALDDETIESVARSILELGEDPVPVLATSLVSETEVTKIINLVKLTSMVGDEGSVSIFNPLLVSDSADICKEVMRALGRLGGKQALQMLLFGSAYVDPRQMVVAVEELGRFREYLAVRRLMEIISPKKKGELPEDESVMVAACCSLGEMGVMQATPTLIDMARGGKRREAYSDELRSTATLALGKIGGPDARKALRGLAKDPSKLVRAAAQEALGG